MPEVGAGRAAATAVLIIAVLLGGLYAVSRFVVLVLGLPPSLGLPLGAVVGGWALVLVGLSMGGWVFGYRSPARMIASTYVTFMKMLGRLPLAERSGRAEPLVVLGPQKYSRNPLYFAVLAVGFGWALATGSTSVLVWSAALLLWFWLVLIPFEERELRALFGEQYAAYAREVPMLIPFTKRRRR